MLNRKRQSIQLRGVVQGVGFRPFVYRLAIELGLVGFVRNDGTGVTIEVEGSTANLDTFLAALSTRTPPLAHIESITHNFIPLGENTNFTIVESQAVDGGSVLVAPDVTTCPDCLDELLNRADRRYRYPFINCTNCGPRFTIVQDIPYDRDKTTMRVFPMCPQCGAEYKDPLNRRFHAQPNACPVCGPQLRLIKADGTPVATQDAVASLAAELVGGAVVVLKGLGGFHLACDALNPEAVARLRGRKHREAKPFALMVPDLASARALCFVSEAEAAVLQSHRRPIVLLRQRPDCPIAPQVAPNYTSLGLMLPYTPLHTLLLHDFAEQLGTGHLCVLVMTSANFSEEPTAYRNEDVQGRLAPLADLILLHNRDIHVRCDDSVTRVVGGQEQLLRRSRGYVPEVLILKQPFPVPILAVGAHLKNTFCLGKDQHALLSHHIGDLENVETLTEFRLGIEHFQRLFDIRPGAVAYDLHPDYLATQYAMSLDLNQKIGIQHHHAHIASVIAEHGLSNPIIGIAADGTGYGSDGTIWGGEVMVATLRGFDRLAHLALLPLPGGEQAIHQPWRMGAVYLQAAYGDNFLNLDIPFVQRLDRTRWGVLTQMIERKLNCPLTSSMGRLFDAVAAQLSVRNEVIYEGQAAIELEMLALPTDEAYPFAIDDQTPMQLDLRPTIRAIVEDLQAGVEVPLIAGRFHRTVAELLKAVCERIRVQTGLNEVALSGGVLQNQLLLDQTLGLLKSVGFTTYINHQVPPNDGGLSLGQAAIAAAILADRVS